MTIKIGLKGSEQDIEQSSLTLGEVSISNFSKKSRSADNTLHVDCLPEKSTRTLSYGVLKKSTYDWWVAMKTLQSSNISPLSYIVGSAELRTYSVFLASIPHGSTLRSDTEYYYGVNIRLEEI
ncbi:MAG: hypothetical protein GY775_17335 [Candidatus Scalindua sp.]|nr:hypothetical protein [Candidatus Scalindua sp.]